MPESNLSKELQRARSLIATRGFKPFFPQIPFEVRQSLAETLSSEESIDHLWAVKRLHRPIADEIPLWDEYAELGNWLDKMDIEEREAEAVQLQYQEECNSRLQEAQKNFEEFLAGSTTYADNLHQVKIARKILSKDDLLIGRTTHEQNDLRRRPSFMADTSHGHIEVEPLRIACVKQANLPVTSTPHVPHRRGQPRVSAVNVSLELFSAETGASRSRAPSLTRIDNGRDRTFELKPDEDENGNPCPSDTSVISAKHETMVQGEKTITKKGNATIVKSLPVDKDPIEKEPQNCGRVPRIASGRGRPAVAPRTIREPVLQGGHKFSSKIQVLPSKAASGPSARVLLPPKSGLPTKQPNSTKSSSGSTTRSSTAITRPSKPGRLPIRK